MNAPLREDKWWWYDGPVDRSPLETLTSIALVSRQFHRVAQPLIYRTILLGGNCDETKRHGHALRMLAAFPELGLCTRTVPLYGSDLQVSRGFNEWAQRLLSSLNLPPALRKHVGTHLEEGLRRQRSLAVFILTSMPHVRLVDISFQDITRASIWMLSGHSDMSEHSSVEEDVEGE